MPYGITQCYLPPGRGDIPAFTPAEAGTRFSAPGGMQGWVDLGGWLEMVYPHNGHQSWTNRARCWLTSFMRPTTLTTTPSRHPRYSSEFLIISEIVLDRGTNTRNWCSLLSVDWRYCSNDPWVTLNLKDHSDTYRTVNCPLNRTQHKAYMRVFVQGNSELFTEIKKMFNVKLIKSTYTCKETFVKIFSSLCVNL